MKKRKSDKIGYFPASLLSLSVEPDVDIMKLRRRILNDKRETSAGKRQKKTVKCQRSRTIAKRCC